MNKGELIGQRFGRLIVDQESTRKSGNNRYWVCVCDCGKVKSIQGSNLANGTTKSCGCFRSEYWSERMTGQRGPLHPTWKGGWITPDGYRCLWIDDKKIPEHRFVMERHLGRKLTAAENVHHINGDRLDNRLENLELWNTSQPSGQRPEDKVRWAVELLRQYAPELLAVSAGIASK